MAPRDLWKLSNEKIGEVTFLKEFDNEFGDDEKKAAIAFEIFVNDETFDFIKQNYLHNKLISFLNLGVDFEFSWEPDGSHRIWKVKKEEEKKNTYELDRLDISNFSMIFSNKEEEGELLVEDVKEEEKLQKESISKVFKQIRTIQFYLMGILFILLWFFFK